MMVSAGGRSRQRGGIIMPPRVVHGPGMYSPLGIFWDVESCPVPDDVAPEYLSRRVRHALREHPGTAGLQITAFSAYTDFNAVPRQAREGWQRTGINLMDVPEGHKDAVDKAMLSDLFLFAMDNPSPAAILLVSTDANFSASLHKLGQRGYQILLAAPGCDGSKVLRCLTSAAQEVWDWHSLVRGEGTVTAPFSAKGTLATGDFSLPPSRASLDRGHQITALPSADNDDSSASFSGSISNLDQSLLWSDAMDSSGYESSRDDNGGE